MCVLCGCYSCEFSQPHNSVGCHNMICVQNINKSIDSIGNVNNEHGTVHQSTKIFHESSQKCAIHEECSQC